MNSSFLKIVFFYFGRSTSNQIEGIMEYTFQDGEVIKPVSFLNELHLLMGMSYSIIYSDRNVGMSWKCRNLPLNLDNCIVSLLDWIAGLTTTTGSPMTTSSFPVTALNLVWVLMISLQESQSDSSTFTPKPFNCIQRKWCLLQIWFRSGDKQTAVQLLISSPQRSSGPQCHQHSPQLQRVTAQRISEAGECYLWK